MNDDSTSLFDGVPDPPIAPPADDAPRASASNSTSGLASAERPRPVAVVRALRGRWVDLRGERLVALPGRALWWPARDTLVVADLHLGKAETYRALGVPMPEGLVEETIRRLGALCEGTAAQRLLILGDLVHAARGLTSTVVDAFTEFLERFQMRPTARVDLVVGNHDEGVEAMPEAWRMHRIDGTLDEPPFVFAHHPGAVRGRYCLAGHLHPTVTLRGAGDRVRLPCFHFGPRVGVLPAFSLFSRGVSMSLVDGDRLLAVVDGEILPIDERQGDADGPVEGPDAGASDDAMLHGGGHGE